MGLHRSEFSRDLFRQQRFPLVIMLPMSVVLDTEVLCGSCQAIHLATIEFMWGEDNPWHRYRIGAAIHWKSGWRDRFAPGLGVRLSEVDPVWVHGLGATPCQSVQDFLIELRGNRIRSVCTIPPVPPTLIGFGWYGVPRSFFHCGYNGPHRTWPVPLDASAQHWLETVSERTSEPT